MVSPINASQAIPQPALTLTDKAPGSVNHLTANPTGQADTLIVESVPGVSVNITEKVRDPVVYERPQVSSIWMRDNKSGGVISSQASKQLASHLDSYREQKQPFTVSSFFGMAGALSHETSRYSNEARYTSAPAGADLKSWSPDFSRAIGKQTEGAVLNVKTRSGATVSMQVNHRQGPDGSSLGFSFQVEGKLTAEEQKAFAKLAEKMGAVADEYFRTGTTELRGLDDIDHTQIESFALSVSRPKGQDLQTLDYRYQVDEETGTRRLFGSDGNGYEFDVSVDSLLSGNSAATGASLEQYLTLIRQAVDTQDASSDTTRFLVDGLRSMLIGSAESAFAQEVSAASRALSAFDTGLPDFKANFTGIPVHNPLNNREASSMNLRMGQETRIEQQGQKTLIAQESFYELNRSYWKASPGLMNPNLEMGNYIYVQEDLSEKTTRTLGLDGDKVDALLIEHEFDHKREEHTYQNFVRVDVQKFADNDQRLVDLLQPLSASSPPLNAQDVEQRARDSRANLFGYWG